MLEPSDCNLARIQLLKYEIRESLYSHVPYLTINIAYKLTWLVGPLVVEWVYPIVEFLDRPCLSQINCYHLI